VCETLNQSKVTMKTKQRENEAKFKHWKLIFMNNWHLLISIKEDRVTNQFPEQFHKTFGSLIFIHKI